jgi:hypothetical protein
MEVTIGDHKTIVEMVDGNLKEVMKLLKKNLLV